MLAIGPLNAEFLHSTAECIGMKVEDLCSATATFDNPLRLVEDFQNMAALYILETR